MGIRVSSLAYYVATIVLIGFAILGDSVSPSIAEEYRHPGQVIARTTKKAAFANVTAWEMSGDPLYTGECPHYESMMLDQKTSDAETGSYELEVSTSYPQYSVVYCAHDFHSRVDPANDNRVDGSWVFPTPAELRSRSVTSTEEGRAAVRRDAVQAAIWALNELAYLSQIDGVGVCGEFAATNAKLADIRHAYDEVLFDLLSVVGHWKGSAVLPKASDMGCRK